MQDRPPKSPDNAVIDLGKKLEDRHVHAQTCVTHWEGEQMDSHLAVGTLCDLDGNDPGRYRVNAFNRLRCRESCR